jgi:hypothetical protein
MPKAIKQKGYPQTVIDEILKPDNRELVTAVSVFAVRQNGSTLTAANSSPSGRGYCFTLGLGRIPFSHLEHGSCTLEGWTMAYLPWR